MEKPLTRIQIKEKDLQQVEFPSLAGRYIVMDTETTGANPKENNIIEIACVEIENGKITGNEFHAFLHPRYQINQISEKKHKLSSNFYENYFNDVYVSDKRCLETFKNFVGSSIIFAHNANLDMQFINNELSYWNLQQIPKKRFMCTMKIFRTIFPNLSRNYCSLSKCCEYFDFVSPNQNFHSAIHDSFMTARIVCKFFEIFNNKENQLLGSKEKEPKDSKILLEKKKERDNSGLDIYSLNDKGEEIKPQESKKMKNLIRESTNVQINASQTEANIPKIKKIETNNKPPNEDDPIVLGINDINSIFDEF